jgi:hypothetical protein
MIRGTTPIILYRLPFTTEIIKSAEITIKYVDGLKKILIIKKLADCEIGEKTIGTRLTQEETLQFPAPAIVSVQLRVVTTDDVILATLPKTTTVEILLAEDVIE